MFLPSHKKDAVVLMINVQSSIIHAALVHMQPGSTPYVLSIIDHPIPFQPRSGTAHLIKITLKGIRETVDSSLRFLRTHIHAGAHLPHSISEIHYILSSPWIVSRARTISHTFSRPTTITQKGVMDIVARERTKDIPQDDSSRIEIVEEKIFDVRLNEYSIAEWGGKNADKLDVSFAVSIAGSGMIDRFREVCSAATRMQSIHFHSSLLLQHIGIQTILPHQDNYMLVHIHGELTDIVIVERRMCIFFGSFPRGIDTLIRSVARSLNATSTIADSLLTLYAEKRVQGIHTKGAETAIQNATSGWTAELAKLFANSYQNKPLPPIAIVSARAHEGFFSEILERAHPEIKTETFSSEQLKPFVSYAPRVETQRLLGLYILAIKQLGMF